MRIDKIKTYDSIIDANGNELLDFSATASAVNYFKMVNSATGDGVDLQALGDDTNIDLLLTPKGTGNVGIGTDSPSEGLHVTGPSAVSALIEAPGSNGVAFQLKNKDYNYKHLLNVNGYSFYDFGNFAYRWVISPNGNVGIGMITPNQKLTIEGTLSLKEQAEANADTVAYGQIWVHDTDPNELFFTDDAGTDTQISSHPLDAPSELYTNGVGIDWISKRVQKYLGKIYWQTLDGKVTIETFEEYNARRKNESGHKDLIKKDWNEIHREKVIAEYQKEEIEIPLTEAVEEVENIEEIESDVEVKTEYVFNNETGKVDIVEKKESTKIKQKTGKFHKKLKDNVRLNKDTGKFYRKRTRAEAEAMIKPEDISDMPKWIKRELNKKKII